MWCPSRFKSVAGNCHTLMFCRHVAVPWRLGVKNREGVPLSMCHAVQWWDDQNWPKFLALAYGSTGKVLCFDFPSTGSVPSGGCHGYLFRSVSQCFETGHYTRGIVVAFLKSMMKWCYMMSLKEVYCCPVKEMSYCPYYQRKWRSCSWEVETCRNTRNLSKKEEEKPCSSVP